MAGATPARRPAPTITLNLPEAGGCGPNQMILSRLRLSARGALRVGHSQTGPDEKALRVPPTCAGMPGACRQDGARRAARAVAADGATLGKSGVRPHRHDPSAPRACWG